MNYSLTHFFFFFRKHVLRKESRPGNYKRMIIAFILSQALILSRGYIPDNLEESLLIKTLFSLRGEIRPPSNLAIISVDDISYKKLGISPRKPFPREVGARALQAIQEDKPSLLLLDLYMPKEEGEEVGTKLMVEALKMGPTSIASAPIMSGDDLYQSDPEIRASAKYELPMTVSVSHGLTLYVNRDLAKFNALSTDDSVPLLKPLIENVNPELKAPEQTAMINYYGPPGTIRNFSLWELFAEERVIPKGFFKDKVVLLGFKSELKERGHSDKEVLGVPVRSNKSSFEMYGVEIHANIAGNLLEGNWIRRLPIAYEAMLIFILLYSLIKGIITYQPIYALAYMVCHLGAWFLGTFVAFSFYGYFIPGVFLAFVFSPIIFGGAACIVATLALRELRELKRVFGLTS